MSTLVRPKWSSVYGDLRDRGFSCQIGKSNNSIGAGVEVKESLSGAERFDKDSPTSEANLGWRGEDGGGIHVGVPSDVEEGAAHNLPSCPLLKNFLQIIEQRAIDSLLYVTEYNLRETLQMSVGPLLYELQKNIREAIEPSSANIKARKLILYAVHDVTLLPLLMALGSFNYKWPPYASDVTLELYQHSEDWFIRLSYNGEELAARGCRAGVCPLKEFLNAISHYSINPEEYNLLCSKLGDTVNG
ncbi:UNVERIFIED_CONTAM: hypothetical protein K2H54_059468 [Gekko kuhli]